MLLIVRTNFLVSANVLYFNRFIQTLSLFYISKETRVFCKKMFPTAPHAPIQPQHSLSATFSMTRIKCLEGPAQLCHRELETRTPCRKKKCQQRAIRSAIWRASKMAQLAKVLANKPEHLSSVPEAYMVGENQHWKLFSDIPTCTVLNICSTPGHVCVLHTKTHTPIKKNVIKF